MSIRFPSLTRSLLPLIPAAVLLIGCGGDETARIKLVPVTGTVTLNNKPLEGAEVLFTPDPENAASTPGSDVTGPDGNYKVFFRGRAGLAPGKYSVVVTKTILPGGASAVGVPEEDRDMYLESFRDPRGRRRPGDNNTVTEIRGEFEREVPPGGGPQDFDVKAKSSEVKSAESKK